MLESLNYSFRNPKKHNLSNLPHQTVENHGVLRGPQRDNQRWWARLGILRVNVVAALVWPKDPVGFADGRVATVRISDARRIKDDDPAVKVYSGRPGWVLGVRPTSPHVKTFGEKPSNIASHGTDKHYDLAVTRKRFWFLTHGLSEVIIFSLNSTCISRVNDSNNGWPHLSCVENTNDDWWFQVRNGVKQGDGVAPNLSNGAQEYVVVVVI